MLVKIKIFQNNNLNYSLKKSLILYLSISQKMMKHKNCHAALVMLSILLKIALWKKLYINNS